MGYRRGAVDVLSGEAAQREVEAVASQLGEQVGKLGFVPEAVGVVVAERPQLARCGSRSTVTTGIDCQPSSLAASSRWFPQMTVPSGSASSGRAVSISRSALSACFKSSSRAAESVRGFSGQQPSVAIGSSRTGETRTAWATSSSTSVTRSVQWLRPGAALWSELRYRLDHRNATQVLAGDQNALQDLLNQWIAAPPLVRWSLWLVQPGLSVARLDQAAGVTALLNVAHSWASSQNVKLRLVCSA